MAVSVCERARAGGLGKRTNTSGQVGDSHYKQTRCAYTPFQFLCISIIVEPESQIRYFKGLKQSIRYRITSTTAHYSKLHDLLAN